MQLQSIFSLDRTCIPAKYFQSGLPVYNTGPLLYMFSFQVKKRYSINTLTFLNFLAVVLSWHNNNLSLFQ